MWDTALQSGIDCKADAGLGFISAVNLTKRYNMENGRKTSGYFSTFQSIYFIQIDYIYTVHCIYSSEYVYTFSIKTILASGKILLFMFVFYSLVRTSFTFFFIFLSCFSMWNTSYWKIIGIAVL